jgi:hypothetical protein
MGHKISKPKGPVPSITAVNEGDDTSTGVCVTVVKMNGTQMFFLAEHRPTINELKQEIEQQDGIHSWKQTLTLPECGASESGGMEGSMRVPGGVGDMCTLMLTHNGKENSIQVRSITIRQGMEATTLRTTVTSVEQVKFDLVDGSLRTYEFTRMVVGEGEGQHRRRGPLPFMLPEGEYVKEVRGRKGFSLDGIQFVTNNGTVSMWYGARHGGGSEFAYVAKEGSEITGLQVKGAGGRAGFDPFDSWYPTGIREEPVVLGAQVVSDEVPSSAL